MTSNDLPDSSLLGSASVAPQTNAASVSTRTSTASVSPRRLAVASGALFFVNGMVYGNWLPRIPELKDQLGLSNTNLGITLLGGGIGGIVGSLLAGRVTTRLGSRRLLLRTIVPLPIVMAVIPYVGEAWMLLATLSLIGLIDVWADVAMNEQGVIAQERLGRSIMNRLHGLWSLGFGTGTLVGSLAGGVGVSFRVQVVAVALVLLGVVGVVARSLERTDPKPQAAQTGDGSNLRHLGIAAIALAVAGAGAIALEGAPNEWAALLMRDDFGFGEWAGFGTVAFGLGMLIGRLSGDHVIEQFGERLVFRIAPFLIAIGLLAVVVGDVAYIGLAGLFVSGLGQSVIFPRLYLLAARVPGMSAGGGLGAMLIGLRLGGMATSVSMGALSNGADLQFALAVVGVVALAMVLAASAVVSRRVRA